MQDKQADGTWNEWNIETFAILRRHFLKEGDDEAFRLLVSLEDRKGMIPFSAGADIATALLMRYYKPELLRSTTSKKQVSKNAVDKNKKE